MLLFVTKALGIAASVFLVLHEFKVHTRLVDNICGFTKQARDALISIVKLARHWTELKPYS